MQILKGVSRVIIYIICILFLIPSIAISGSESTAKGGRSASQLNITACSDNSSVNINSRVTIRYNLTNFGRCNKNETGDAQVDEIYIIITIPDFLKPPDDNILLNDQNRKLSVGPNLSLESGIIEGYIPDTVAANKISTNLSLSKSGELKFYISRLDPRCSYKFNYTTSAKKAVQNEGCSIITKDDIKWASHRTCDPGIDINPINITDNEINNTDRVNIIISGDYIFKYGGKNYIFNNSNISLSLSPKLPLNINTTNYKYTTNKGDSISYAKPYYIVSHTGEQLQFGLKKVDEEPIYDDEIYLVKNFREYHYKLSGVFILSIILFFMLLKLFENPGVIHMAAFGSAIFLLNIIAHDLLSGIGIEYYYPDVLAYEFAAFIISLIILYKIYEHRKIAGNFFKISRLINYVAMSIVAYSLSFDLFGFLPNKVLPIISFQIFNLTITNMAVLRFIMVLPFALSIFYVYTCIKDSGCQYHADARPFVYIIFPLVELFLITYPSLDDLDNAVLRLILTFITYIGYIVLAGILIADYEQLAKSIRFRN
ncbi:MAG: hypothetical protein WCP70_00170 [Methanothrix sp.]